MNTLQQALHYKVSGQIFSAPPLMVALNIITHFSIVSVHEFFKKKWYICRHIAHVIEIAKMQYIVSMMAMHLPEILHPKTL